MPNELQAPLDGAKAFLLFLHLNGSLEQTAVSMSAPLVVIKELAAREDWQGKLAELGRDADSTPAEQRVINQTVNFIQAHRMRAVLDTAMEHVRQEMEKPGGPEKLLFSPGRDGSTFSARGLTDLVKAMEACQMMTERALGTDEDAPKGKGAESMFISVMKAMNAADAVGVNSVEVVREQLKAPAVATRRSLRDAVKPKPAA